MTIYTISMAVLILLSNGERDVVLIPFRSMDDCQRNGEKVARASIVSAKEFLKFECYMKIDRKAG